MWTRRYPDDSTPQGRELRLKQEYFFTAASVRDILRRFESQHADLAQLPAKVAIQMNDTHPAIAGPEFVRLLVDERGMEFDAAFEIARGCLHYTNHTLLPEALERWPVELVARVLPRHMQIIERIDERHARDCAAAGRARSAGLRICGEGEVRMGELAFVTARRVNGVSALHTELMKKTVFSELHALHPERILNQTNGVTPRRWLHGCNPPLRALLNDAIGDGWVDDLSELARIAPLADDAGFRTRFAAAKRENKARLADWARTAANPLPAELERDDGRAAHSGGGPLRADLDCRQGSLGHRQHEAGADGALTIGTLDGANIEIAERVGRENIFIFGLTAEEIAARQGSYDPGAAIAASPRLAEAIEQIASERFSPDQPDRFLGIAEALRHGDRFMLCVDFGAYWNAQRVVDRAWRDPAAWNRSAVLNTAGCGWFTSDRAVRGYAREIWGAEAAL